MKPAFHPDLPLSDDKTKVDAGGPYELEGGETDAYFWFRISQGDVEAIGVHEREKDEMKAELKAASNAIRDAVTAAVAGSLPAAGPVTAQHQTAAAAAARDAAIAALAEHGPKWVKKNVKARESKAFKTGEATAEGWLLMKSEGDPTGSNTFWTSKVTLNAKTAKPATP
jgi:hypothetical protein